MPSSRRHEAGLERRVDDRKLDGLRLVILVTKTLADPHPGLAARADPAEASHGLGHGQLATQLSPRKLEPLRQDGNGCCVGRDTIEVGETS